MQRKLDRLCHPYHQQNNRLSPDLNHQLLTLTPPTKPISKAMSPLNSPPRGRHAMLTSGSVRSGLVIPFYSPRSQPYSLQRPAFSMQGGRLFFATSPHPFLDALLFPLSNKNITKRTDLRRDDEKNKWNYGRSIFSGWIRYLSSGRQDLLTRRDR